MKAFLTILCLLLSGTGLFHAEHARAADLPFRPGERLTYKLFWEFIPAGSAVLEVLPMETLDSVQAYHFAVTAQSNEFIDSFYKVRDRIDAYADSTMTHSLLYRKDQQEGRHRRKVTVTFDWTRSEAQYSNFGKKNDPIPLMPGTFDPLSVFFAFRRHPLGEGAQISIPVTDGKKNVVGKAQVVAMQNVKVLSGQYTTYLVEVDLKDAGGIFEKSKEARLKIWVTADDRRLPVKLSSKVAIGDFVGELAAIDQP